MSKPLTGRHVLFGLLVIFGVVFAVNGIFIARAIETYPGEDVANPYLQGVDYNKTLAAHASQAAEGWKATIEAHRAGTSGLLVRVTIDNHRYLPASFNLNGLLRHPMDAERDRRLAFHAAGNGAYEAELAGVPSGGWDVVVSAVSNSPFEASRRIWLP
jgi:nitrogen fixation protein FixH